MEPRNCSDLELLRRSSVSSLSFLVQWPHRARCHPVPGDTPHPAAIHSVPLKSQRRAGGSGTTTAADKHGDGFRQETPEMVTRNRAPPRGPQSSLCVETRAAPARIRAFTWR